MQLCRAARVCPVPATSAILPLRLLPHARPRSTPLILPRLLPHPSCPRQACPTWTSCAASWRLSASRFRSCASCTAPAPSCRSWSRRCWRTRGPTRSCWPTGAQAWRPAVGWGHGAATPCTACSSDAVRPPARPWPAVPRSLLTQSSAPRQLILRRPAATRPTASTHRARPPPRRRRFAGPLGEAHAAERLGRFEELLEAAVDMARVPDEYLISPTYDQVGGGAGWGVSVWVG